MACILCIGLVGGAFAYFTDTETSTGNTFTSGVAIIAMSNDDIHYKTDGSLVICTAANLAPGQEVGPFDVYFKNKGTVSGVVTVDIDYAAAPSLGTPPPGYPPDVGTATIGQFAKKLIVTYAESDLVPTVNVAPYWALQIAEETGDGTWGTAVANGYIVEAPGETPYAYLPTIRGLKEVTLAFTDGYGGPDVPLAPNGVHSESMKLALDSGADNTYAWMGITIDVTATITSN